MELLHLLGLYFVFLALVWIGSKVALLVAAVEGLRSAIAGKGRREDAD